MVACPVELHESPMVDYPVNHDRGELVVAEDGPLFKEAVPKRLSTSGNERQPDTHSIRVAKNERDG